MISISVLSQVNMADGLITVLYGVPCTARYVLAVVRDALLLLKALSFSCDTYLTTLRFSLGLCDTYLMILISVKSPATTNNCFIAVFTMHQYLKKCFYSSSQLISCDTYLTRLLFSLVLRDTYLMRITSYLMWYVSHKNQLLPDVIRISWESSLTWCDTYLIRINSYLMWYISHENHLLPYVIRIPWFSYLSDLL